MPLAWISLITQLAQTEFYYAWNQTLVICPIPVLSWNHRTTIGDQTTDKFLRLPSLEGFPGGISLEININPRRGGDVDRLRHPSLRGLHLQTLAKEAESQKDPNSLTRRGEEDIDLLLLHLIISPMIMADTKEVDIVCSLHRILAYYSLWK